MCPGVLVVIERVTQSFCEQSLTKRVLLTRINCKTAFSVQQD